MSQFAAVRKDNEHIRLPSGELVRYSRHEAQRAEGVWGGETTYPATTKYDTRGVPWTPEWYAFMAHPLINTPEAARALMRNNGGLFNSADNGDAWPGGSIIPPPPWAEPPIGQCVVTALNLVEVLEVKNGRARIRVFDVRQPPPDPAAVNPRTTPWMFDRFRSVNDRGEYGDAPDGIRSYIPRLSRDGNAWLPLEALKFVDKPEMEAEMTTPRRIPQGKGMYVYIIARLAKAYGSNQAFAEAMKAAGVRRIELKVTDGANNYNQRPVYNALGLVSRWEDDIIEPFVAAAKAAGIEVWGWSYIYGKVNVEAQAKAAMRQIERLGLAGLIVNAEKEFFGYGPQASQYMNLLHALLPDVPIGFTSFRFPTNFPSFPWAEFLRYADFAQPQVYWEGASNPAEQLRRSLAEYRKYTAAPLLPIGAAYEERGWRPTPAQMDEFYEAAVQAGCPGWSWWEAWHAWNLGLVPVIAGHGPAAAQPIPAPEPPADGENAARRDELEKMRDYINQRITALE